MLAEHCLQVVLSTDFTDFTDFCYASGASRRHQVNQGYQWLKINVDARRVVSSVYFIY